MNNTDLSPKLSTRKKHYYMACVLVSYFREKEDGIKAAKQRSMNVVIEISDKEITYEVLNNARAGVLQRMQQELQIEPEAVVDLCFNNIFYMGHMSQKGFYGQVAKTQNPVN